MHPLRRALNTLMLGVLSLGTSSCIIPKQFDLAVSASEGRDSTVVLSGCNQGIHSGYLFCRKNEGAAPTDAINLIVPKTKCNRDSCAQLQFLNKDGSFGYAASIKAGENKAAFKVSDVIGTQNPITVDNDGEYSVLVKVWFIGPDDSEHEMFSKGLVRLLVLTPKYQSLTCNDPQVGWIDDVKTCQINHSTAYRTAVCGKDCEPVIQ